MDKGVYYHQYYEYIFLYIICFVFTKERVKESAEESGTQNPWLSLKSLLHNKYWVALTVASVLTYGMIAVYSGATAYFAQYNLGNIDHYPIIANALSAAQVIGLMTIVPIMIKKKGRYITYQAGISLMFLACLGTVVLGWILTAGNFDAALSVQSESARTAISISYYWLPAVALLVIFLIMMSYRKLDKIFPQISAELQERRNKEK